MYNDETILTYGKYKMWKLKDIPVEYFQKIWGNGGTGDIDLMNWIKENREKLDLKSKQIIQEASFVPFICDKKTFSTKADAKQSLSKIRESKGDHIKPMRTYECPKCSGWHLTSMPIEVFKINS